MDTTDENLTSLTICEQTLYFHIYKLIGNLSSTFLSNFVQTSLYTKRSILTNITPMLRFHPLKADHPRIMHVAYLLKLVHFCSLDLDLDPITLTYEQDLKIISIPKVNCSYSYSVIGRGFQKLEQGQNRQSMRTDRQMDATERITSRICTR